ncbi:hypothetical protein GZH46_00188, partial [Fragariocoptes setiger]
VLNTSQFYLDLKSWKYEPARCHRLFVYRQRRSMSSCQRTGSPSNVRSFAPGHAVSLKLRGLVQFKKKEDTCHQGRNGEIKDNHARKRFNHHGIVQVLTDKRDSNANSSAILFIITTKKINKKYFFSDYALFEESPCHN